MTEFSSGGGKRRGKRRRLEFGTKKKFLGWSFERFYILELME